MSDINPELVEKAADIIMGALDNHGHANTDCHPDTGMDLYVTAATRAALSAVADDLRAEALFIAALLNGRAKAEALREAAAEMERDKEWGFTGHAVPAWLRARADRIEARDE